jgi:hypothetical protein
MKNIAAPGDDTLGAANPPPVPPPVAIDHVDPADAMSLSVQSVPVEVHPLGGVITEIVALPLT